MKTDTSIFFERIICMEWYVAANSTFSLFFLIDTVIDTINTAFEKIRENIRNLLRQVLVLQPFYDLHTFELLNIENQQFIYIYHTPKLLSAVTWPVY